MSLLSPSSHPDLPRLGDLVYYYDEDKRPHAATVAFIHDKVGSDGVRPICNLAITLHNGFGRGLRSVSPAFHDGKIWRLISKWSWPDEIPKKDCNLTLEPNNRTRLVGLQPNNTIA